MFELETAVEESRTRTGVKNLARLMPRIGVAALFAFGYTKFDDDPRGECVQISERIGFGRWFRYFTGVM